MKTTSLQSNIVRNERGLSIKGTRITLYDVMDYVTENWPPKLIQCWLNLSDEQITDALNYIKNNQTAIESEYQEVLKYAAKIQQYWNTRNKKRFAEIANLSPKPGHKKLRAKIQASKLRLGLT
ncbi:DUF433 domain-containing protein [Candidatus Magnetomoraceae bacterium gMMP-15]